MVVMIETCDLINIQYMNSLNKSVHGSYASLDVPPVKEGCVLCNGKGRVSTKLFAESIAAFSPKKTQF